MASFQLRYKPRETPFASSKPHSLPLPHSKPDEVAAVLVNLIQASRNDSLRATRLWYVAHVRCCCNLGLLLSIVLASNGLIPLAYKRTWGFVLTQYHSARGYWVNN